VRGERDSFFALSFFLSSKRLKSYLFCIFFFLFRFVFFLRFNSSFPRGCAPHFPIQATKVPVISSIFGFGVVSVPMCWWAVDCVVWWVVDSVVVVDNGDFFPPFGLFSCSSSSVTRCCLAGWLNASTGRRYGGSSRGW
jgi:hypothetical protein